MVRDQLSAMSDLSRLHEGHAATSFNTGLSRDKQWQTYSEIAVIALSDLSRLHRKTRATSAVTHTHGDTKRDTFSLLLFYTCNYNKPFVVFFVFLLIYSILCFYIFWHCAGQKMDFDKRLDAACRSPFFCLSFILASMLLYFLALCWQNV